MTEPSIFRIVDAALNRAGEGLRVVEDYVRFIADDPFLTGQFKQLRHDLAAAAALLNVADRHAARETLKDIGTDISTGSEKHRGGRWDVCAASLKRTEQSLRSLEEYGKLVDADFAGQCESLRYRVYTLEKAIDIGRASRERLAQANLCVLLDGCDSTEAFQQTVAQLVQAGVGMVQLRDKQLEDRDLVDRGRILRRLTRSTETLAIINDRADVAAAVQADGVHLGQEDLNVKDARAIVGTRTLIGVSTHNIEQARTAVLDGANYLGAGPTFPSQTKVFDDFAGLGFLREIAAEIRLPTFAIGGINVQNVSEVIAVRVERIAVGNAVTGAKAPGSAARELLCMLKNPAAAATSPVLTSDP
jgi:thiamine-phosphate pyrophosphorylase